MFLVVSCTIATMEGSDRKRLAREVISRRVELGMHTTKALASAAGLSARMLGDVENGRRDNFSPGAKAQIERALRWDAGSIDATLAGGKPSVSGILRDRSGRAISQWTSIEGGDQEQLELYRLAYIIVDTRDLVRAQKGPLMTALTALLDEATDLVMKNLARRRSGHDDIDDEDMSDARWFVDETRETNNIRRQGDIYVVDDEKTLQHLGPRPHPAPAADDELLRRRKVIEASLLNHYSEMYRRAAEERQRKTLVDQAHRQLGDPEPHMTFQPEVGDGAYVEYLAARLSTPHQGGDPDLYDALSLNHTHYQAARARYRREFAEMVVFDGRLRTAGAPATGEYAGDDLTSNDAPPDLADAARKLKPGQHRQQPEQGEGDEGGSQVDPQAGD